MKRKTAAILIGVIVILGGGTAAGAGTHWFGLGHPQYSRQMIRICNSDFRQEASWLKAVQDAEARLDTGAAEHYLIYVRAYAHDLKSRGCPDGPYPLPNSD